MKYLLILSLLIPSISFSQVISPSPSNLVFNPTTVGTTDSIALTLNNRSNQAVNVTNLKFYTVYNDFPFSASQSSFTIPANGQYTIQIYFTPQHNIWHNSELVVAHNANSGYEAIDVVGQGVFADPYYALTQNLSEELLKDTLKFITTRGYRQLSYNAARDAMFMTIDNKRVNGQNTTSNQIECVYTGFNKSGYTSRSAAQSSNPNFNTEHTFPQGFFNQALPMRSDIHHLFPTTNNSNSQRGSKPFGTVSNGTPVTLGGGSFYNNSTFEPRNAQKGATARAMMYFVLRYQDYANHFSVQENILRTWHNTYPVNSIEERRNNDIFIAHNNRNPFVDYPQLEERITNFVSNSVAPQVFGLDILQTAVHYGTAFIQQADTFDYVIVNRGNRTINISNITVSNNAILSFRGSSSANVSIPPGESLEIGIILQTTTPQTVAENLTFNTNIPGSLGSFTIPIRANTVVSINENELANKVNVYPNPFGDHLNVNVIEPNTLKIKLYDMLGKAIDAQMERTNGRISIATDLIPNGVYFMELSDRNQTVIKKLIKQD